MGFPRIIDPARPETWPPGPAGILAVSKMLGDEIQQLFNDYVDNRLMPAMRHAAAQGYDVEPFKTEFIAGMERAMEYLIADG